MILILATVCIAAAGNIINDIYDIEADKVNKPSKLLVTKSISKKQADFLYIILNIVGVLLGLYLSHTIKNISFVAIFYINCATFKDLFYFFKEKTNYW